MNYRDEVNAAARRGSIRLVEWGIVLGGLAALARLGLGEFSVIKDGARAGAASAQYINAAISAGVLPAQDKLKTPGAK